MPTTILVGNEPGKPIRLVASKPNCLDIVQRVLEQWKNLVASEEREGHYQQFLAEHAGMFFGTDGTSLTISQLQLGTEHRPDLVVVHDCRSGGLLYEFIELKRPSHAPYSESTQAPSQYLNKALEQVREWQARIEDNCAEIQERLPAIRAADRHCSFTVVIGRREESKDWLVARNRLADRLSNKYRVNIRSYDYLTDELAGRQFAHSSPIWLSGDELTLNRLANPFTTAFTDRLWRALLRRLKQASPVGLAAYESHFFTCAKSEIVRCLRHNALFDELLIRQGMADAQHPE
ncbi:MAG: Shedu anti-phage system protein SduA domain-containing protein [Verrucomicrobiota bacterium]